MKRLLLCALFLSPAAMAQETQLAPKQYTVDRGSHILLTLINSPNTKKSEPGDRVYLRTAFPVMANGRIVVPTGSYVNGTVTKVKRPGKVKGRGELSIRFDALILENGVTRDFRARIGGIDGRGSEELDRSEGKVISEGNKGGDVRTVAETTVAGASLGAVIGAASKSVGKGAGIGMAAGAAAGLAEVLLTHGPEATLAQGSTIEMVLDRPLVFTDEDLNAVAGSGPSRFSDNGGGPAPSVKQNSRLGRRPL